MGLFVVIAVLWMHPVVSSWRSARDVIDRQRQLYDAYRAQATQYRDLQITHHHHHILPYEYLAAALDEVQSLARHHGLITTQFTSSEPASHGVAIYENFVEIRAITSFTGPKINAIEFIGYMAEMAVFIHNTRMDILDDGTVTLRAEFSLFGREE